MTSNETARKETTEAAYELSQVYKWIIGNHSFTHFDMNYHDMPLQRKKKFCERFDFCVEVIDMWIEQGGQGWQLIEPVDGKNF